MTTDPESDLARVKRPGRGAILAFLAIAFGFSWVQWIAVIAGSRGWIRFHVPLTPLGSFGPAIAAFVVLGATASKGALGEWRRSIVRWRVPLWTALAACLLPPAVAALSFLVAAKIRGVAVGPKLPGPGLLAAATIEIFLVGGPLGEEPGWRGFLLPRLADQVGVLRATVAVWFFWFAWHLPLFWVPGSGQQDIPLAAFAIALLSYAVLLTWLYESSGASTLAAMVLHTSINVTFVFAARGVLEKGQARLFWPLYLGGLAAIALAVLAVSRVFRRRVI